MAASPVRRLLLSGMLRSGTTLLDKVLNAHPQLIVASQPLFELFVYAKQKYNTEKGIDGLPLSPGFLDASTLRNGFMGYLPILQFDAQDIARLRVRIPEANHQWSPAISEKRLSVLRPGSFFHVLDQCLTIVNEAYGKSGGHWVGIKEVLCEEFLPILIGSRFKGIIVYRDPRAVICSATTGGYERFVGKARPILLDIRNWRKSIAYIIRLRDNPDFISVCYEELVAHPATILNKLTRFLAVDAFPEGIRLDRLHNQDGKPWEGNSSAASAGADGQIDTHRWRKMLSPDQISFIEYCCRPEMTYLGYRTTEPTDETIVHTYRDRFSDDRKDYAPDHHLNAANRNAEIQRIALIHPSNHPDADTIERFFLGVDVWQELRSAMHSVKAC